jgi:hypothetical protein
MLAHGAVLCRCRFQAERINVRYLQTCPRHRARVPSRVHMALMDVIHNRARPSTRREGIDTPRRTAPHRAAPRRTGTYVSTYTGARARARSCICIFDVSLITPRARRGYIESRRVKRLLRWIAAGGAEQTGGPFNFQVTSHDAVLTKFHGSLVAEL